MTHVRELIPTIKVSRARDYTRKQSNDMSDNLKTMAWQDVLALPHITVEQLEQLTTRLAQEEQANTEKHHDIEQRKVDLATKTRKLNEDRAKFERLKDLHREEMRRSGLLKM